MFVVFENMQKGNRHNIRCLLNVFRNANLYILKQYSNIFFNLQFYLKHHLEFSNLCLQLHICEPPWLNNASPCAVSKLWPAGVTKPSPSPKAIPGRTWRWCYRGHQRQGGGPWAVTASKPSQCGCWEGNVRCIPPLLPPRGGAPLAFICPGDQQTTSRQPSNNFPLWKRGLRIHPLPKKVNISGCTEKKEMLRVVLVG